LARRPDISSISAAIATPERHVLTGAAELNGERGAPASCTQTAAWCFDPDCIWMILQAAEGLTDHLEGGEHGLLADHLSIAGKSEDARARGRTGQRNRHSADRLLGGPAFGACDSRDADTELCAEALPHAFSHRASHRLTDSAMDRE
jgi:hypothetical protein